jgi:hypothetical protein
MNRRQIEAAEPIWTGERFKQAVRWERDIHQPTVFDTPEACLRKRSASWFLRHSENPTFADRRMLGDGFRCSAECRIFSADMFVATATDIYTAR